MLDFLLNLLYINSMNLTHGLIMFFIGVPITIIGFYIAYSIASRTVKKKEPLTEVEQSIKDLYNK